MEIRTLCHDCAHEIIFQNGVPDDGQVPVCWRCAEKRRKNDAMKPDFEGFVRGTPELMIDGKPAAIARVRAF